MGERESESERCGRVGGGGPVMDTPDRNQINTPVSQFEDSPVFNFINSLSPIKTDKSLCISQTFNSLSFASLPSIFTSPQVSSLKESRFLKRHQFSETSKPELSSENGNKVGGSEGLMDVVHNSNEERENFDPGNCIGEAYFEHTYECSKLAIEVSRTLDYDCQSPDYSARPCSGTKTKCMSKLGGASASVPLEHEVSETSFLGSGVHFEGISNIENNKDMAGRDWESLISDAAGLLSFDSPKDMEAFKVPFQKQLNPGTRLRNSLISEFSCDEINDLQNKGAVGTFVVEECESEGHLKEIEVTEDILASTSLNKPENGETTEQIDNQLVSNLHRGMRRRCLIFEIAGARKRHFDDCSSSGSSMLSQSDVYIESDDKKLVPMKPGNDSSHCILPGIGLHLNALARTSNDYSIISHETLASVQEPLNKSLSLISVERNMGPAENGVQGIDEASQASGYMAREDFNQSSPKKRRRRLENASETEGCKRCNCKKSKCLKLYCECFAAGIYCVEPCTCQDCLNKPIHEETVLATRKQIESRNPLAFAPKVIRSTDSVPEIGDESSKTPASARHKRGCNCKKSGCLKKYCECYQGGVGCSMNCRCEGCKNAFGQKEGSALMGTEGDLEEEEEEEETESGENSMVDKSLQQNEIPNSIGPNSDYAIPATPLRYSRAMVPLPFSYKNKPPRSSFLSIGSSSGFYGSRRFGKPNFVQPQPKFENQISAVEEDEIPKILQENCSPTGGIKSASPNSKRVSPPHCNFGSAPGRSSSRKLILQSIPSFPSLTPKN